MKKVVVYVYLSDRFVPAGILRFNQEGRYSSAIFRYAGPAPGSQDLHLQV